MSTRRFRAVNPSSTRSYSSTSLRRAIATTLETLEHRQLLNAGNLLTSPPISTDVLGTDNATSVTFDPSGNLVVAGQAGGTNFGIARYTTSGSVALDPSFDLDGLVTIPQGGLILARGVVADASHVFVGGFGFDAGSGSTDFILARTTNAGSSPTVSSPIDIGSSTADQVSTIVRLSDGTVVAVGISNGNVALARFNPTSLALDSSGGGAFGSGGGIVVTSILGGVNVAGATVDSSGRIVVAATADGNLLLLRYLADGSADTGFNGTGQLTIPLGGGSARAVATQSDGSVVVVSSESGNVRLRRVSADGSSVSSAVNLGSGTGTGVVVQSHDHRIAVSITGAGGTYKLTRLNTDLSVNSVDSLDGTGSTTAGSGVSTSGIAYNQSATARRLAIAGTVSNNFGVAVFDANIDPTATPVAGPHAVTANGTRTLTNAILNAADLDDVNSGVTFAVNSVTNGHIALASAPGTAITSFTLAQVLANQIVYKNNGTTGAASFAFTVSDAFGGSDSTGNTVNFNVTANAATVYVDDSWAGLLDGTSVSGTFAGLDYNGNAFSIPFSGTIGVDAFSTINAAYSFVAPSGDINILAGAYAEDVDAANVAKGGVTFRGTGLGDSDVRGIPGGGVSTFRLAVSGLVVEGLEITRAGDVSGGPVTAANWNDPLNTAGVSVQGLGIVATIRNNLITGNRTGIDLNNVNNVTVYRNNITDNRTGLIMRNAVTSSAITQNFVTNNWTAGVLVLNAGTEDMSGSVVSGNSIFGNWYTQIENRSAGDGAKNFSGNWLGQSNIVAGDTANTDGTEPGYGAIIPTSIPGGTSVPPGGALVARGVGLGDLDFTPYLNTGVDQLPAVPGFQGSSAQLNVTALGGQSLGVGRVNEAIAGVDLNGTVLLDSGTYDETVLVNRSVTLDGRVDDGAVITRTAGSQQVLVTIAATNVTVKDIAIQVNQAGAIAPVGIAATTSTTTDFNGLVLDNNTITSVGNNTTANWTGQAGPSVRAAGIVLYDSPSGGIPTVTLTNNNISILSGTSFFQRGVWLAQLNATITGNTIAAFANDLLFQFPSGGASTISGNSFNGVHSLGGAGLLIGDPNSGAPVTVSNNQFNTQNTAAAGTALQVNRGAASGSPIVISGNQFNGFTTGVAVGGARDVSISGNFFTPQAGATGVVGVVIDSQSASNNADPSTPINTTVDGNTFNANGASVTAVRVENDLAGANFTGVTIGGTTDNTYDANLVTGVDVVGGNVTVSDSIGSLDTGVTVSGGTVTLSNATLTGNTVGVSVSNTGSLTAGSGNSISGGVTGIRFSGSGVGLTGLNLGTLNINASGNYIELLNGAFDNQDLNGQGLTLGGNAVSSMTNPQLFAVEAKLVHEPDDLGVGFITLVPNTIFVIPTTTPTATDNDYTRIRNAIEAADSGWTIILGKNGTDGEFNWDETNALESWKRGNDGVIDGSYVDDYSITLKANQNNLTITANAADAISIKGPGDISTVDLEAGIQGYRNGSNTGLTIENFKIEGIDNALGFYYFGGGSNFSGLTIQNMTIVVPADVDTAGDSFQNIGIHYAFGQNIKILNNDIIFAAGGDATGDSIGIQSNTHGGTSYDGLLISGNDLVVNAGAMNEFILGVWENGHAHLSDVTISNNSFTNNAPSTVTQARGFRVTSHSSASTTVAYSGNTVTGADIGFEWLNSSNFAGNQPVVLTNNVLSGVNTGYLVRSNGSATISGGSVSGASGVGVDIAAGSNATISGVSFQNLDVGIRVGGAAVINGNNFNSGVDNDTDIQFLASAGASTIGAGNLFGGSNYFIDNASSNSFNLTSYTAANFEGLSPSTLADAFRIEDLLRHKTDLGNTSAGLIRIVAGNIYVTAPGTGLSHESIQSGIDAANAGDTVNIEAGTYSENVVITKDIDLLGDLAGGTTLTSAVANSRLIRISAAGTFGTADDQVSISNLNLDGGTVAEAGLYVDGSADLGTLVLSNADVKNTRLHGVYVDAAAIVSGSPTVSAMLQNLVLSNLDFTGNGITGGGGSADVQLFGYNNNANFTNLTLVGSRNEGAGTGARIGIQLRGVGAANGSGVAAMGNVSMTNIDISGSYRNAMLTFQRYSTANTLTLSSVKLGGGSSALVGSFGAALRFDAVGGGTVSSPATVDLGDTLFRGLAGVNAYNQVYDLEFAPDNGFAFLRADARDTQWTSAGNVASGLSLADAFDVEDRILHYVDKLHPTHFGFGGYRGYADLQTGKVFVTDQANLNLAGEGSIQRAVDVAGVGHEVWVDAGVYQQNVSINKNVKLLSGSGRSSTTIEGVAGVGASGTIVLTNNTTGVQIGSSSGNGFTIVGFDNGNPASENAAVYFQGSHSGAQIRNNEIVANGDLGMLSEWTLGINNFVIDGNIFSGKTFVGSMPASGDQFTVPNVARQLIALGGGGGSSNLQFTNNQITGTAGGVSGMTELGNHLVTIDVAGSTITGNTFAGTATASRYALRVRGSNSTINNNQFTSSSMSSSTTDLDVEVPFASINGNTFTSSAGTAIVVTGTGAGTLSGNTIDGYNIGVAVIGAGTNATIDGNSIRGSGVGVLNAGNATVSTNTFSGGSDNDIDLQIGASASSTTIGNGNSFAGDDFFIRNESAQAFNLIGNTSTFDESNNYRIEDKMFHALDAATSGLIRRIANQLFVTAPGTGASDETIQRAINAASSSDTINVEAGTYSEDVLVNKSGITLLGSGAASTIVQGVENNGLVDTVQISGSNVTVAGFTITRTGNTPATWTSPGLNNQGVAIYGTNIVLRDNIITGNRNGVYMDGGATNVLIRNNFIENNRTGIHVFQVNGLTVAENYIRDNWTVGLLFRNENPTNPTTGPINVNNNSISGNYYAGLEQRWNNTSVVINAAGNYWGKPAPTYVINSAGNAGEPGYSNTPLSIPVALGGTGAPIPGAPDILESSNPSTHVAYAPYLTTGTDTNVSAYGDTFAFQGDFATLGVQIDGPSVVNENTTPGSYVLQLSPNNPGTPTITGWQIDWDGDGIYEETVAGNPTSVTHTYPDGLNTYTINARAITTSFGTVQANSINVTVNNVAPTVAISGASSVNEGSTYSLTVNNAVDPGADTVINYIIDWGDGSTPTVVTPAQLALAGNVLTHTYADGPNSYAITVTVVDEDGTFSNVANPLSVTVNNVAPSIAIDTVTSSIGENQTAQIVATITDPGSLEVFSVTIDWADPNSSGATVISGLLSSGPVQTGTVGNTTYSWDPATRQITLTHLYVDDGASPGNGTSFDVSNVSLSVADDDAGTGSTSTSIQVKNAAPTSVAIAPAGGNINSEGQTLNFTASASDNPNDVLTYSWSITGPGIGSPITGSGTAISFTAPDDGVYTITLTVTDDDGQSSSPLVYNVTVNDVAPTVVITSKTASINENGTASITFRLIDPGQGDLAATAQVSVDWGDGSPTTVINAGTAPALLAALQAGLTVTLTKNYTDNPVGFPNGSFSLSFGSFQNPPLLSYPSMALDGTSLAASIQVNNVDPTGILVSSTPTISAGNPASINWIVPNDVSPVDASSLRYSYGIDPDGAGPSPVTWIIGNGTYAGSVGTTSTATLAGSNFTSPGTYTVVSRILDKDGGVQQQSTTIVVTPVSFRVTSFTANASGFDIVFNRNYDPTVLNLYSAFGSDPSDVVVTGPGGVVLGTLVFTGPNSVTFVATGGILANGNYTVTLRSASNGFRDAPASSTPFHLLDGDGNNVGGDNYSTSFNVSNGAGARVVSIPDFARGPGQLVQVPAGLPRQAYLPIQVNGGASIGSLDVQLRIDPSMLTVTSSSFSLSTAAAAAGWTLVVNQLVNGDWALVANGLPGSLATASLTDVIVINANVPMVATYGASQVLRIVSSKVSGVTSVSDNAVHAVAYIGDADADSSGVTGRYSGNDASLIRRVAAGLDSGFGAYPTIDPAVIGDVDGVPGILNALSGNDAAIVAHRAANAFSPTAVPEIPPVPGEVPSILAPTSGTFNAPARASMPVGGGTTTLPIRLANSATPVYSASFTIKLGSALAIANNGISLTSQALAAGAIYSAQSDASGNTVLVIYSSLPLPTGVNLFNVTIRSLSKLASQSTVTITAVMGTSDYAETLVTTLSNAVMDTPAAPTKPSSKLTRVFTGIFGQESIIQ